MKRIFILAIILLFISSASKLSVTNSQSIYEDSLTNLYRTPRNDNLYSPYKFPHMQNSQFLGDGYVGIVVNHSLSLPFQGAFSNSISSPFLINDFSLNMQLGIMANFYIFPFLSAYVESGFLPLNNYQMLFFYARGDIRLYWGIFFLGGGLGTNLGNYVSGEDAVDNNRVESYYTWSGSAGVSIPIELITLDFYVLYQRQFGSGGLFFSPLEGLEINYKPLQSVGISLGIGFHF